jgi:hypothetical protein
MKSPVKPSSSLSILCGEDVAVSSSLLDTSSSSSAAARKTKKPPAPQPNGDEEAPPTTPKQNKKSDFEALFDELAIASSRPWLFDKEDNDTWEEFDHESSVASSSSSSASSCNSSTVSPEDDDDDDSAVESGSGQNIIVTGPNEDHQPPVVRRRVHFCETGPEDRDIMRTYFESTVDYENIREQWYTAAHFRKFRTLCQETAVIASRDVQYCQDFMSVYNKMNNHHGNLGNGGDTVGPILPVVLSKERILVTTNGKGGSIVPHDRLDYSDYRGLERAIFRHTLVTDKFSNIKGIVLAAKELSDPHALALVCHEFTATARGMARHLAVLDRLVVDPQSPMALSPSSSSSMSSTPTARRLAEHRRQFLEI